MLLASKISAQGGDVRKALDVCRRAVELYAPTAENGNYFITFIPLFKG